MKIALLFIVLFLVQPLAIAEESTLSNHITIEPLDVKAPISAPDSILGDDGEPLASVGLVCKHGYLFAIAVTVVGSSSITQVMDNNKAVSCVTK